MLQLGAIVEQCDPLPAGAREGGRGRGSKTPCQNTSGAERATGRGAHLVDTPGEQVTCSPPRCIAVPRLDGHTRARLRFDPGALTAASNFLACRELAELVTDLRRPRTKLEEKRERRSGLMVRRMPTGEHAEVTVSGTRRQLIAFHVWGHVHVTVNVDEGEARVQWKAAGLWSVRDQRFALAKWIATISTWLTGEPVTLPDSFAAGWTMTGLEICADFVDLRWRRRDVESFVGRYSRGTRDALRTKDGDRLESFTGVDGEVQTINIGSRASNVSWCLYDKTGQIDRAKDGANLPTYAATWKANGWRADEEVSRVELRLSSRGLVFQLSTGVELNLRDPNQCDPLNLQLAWAHACAKYRLVDLSTATRIERCRTDERWEVVADAAGLALVSPARQARAVAEDHHAEKVRRSARAVSCGIRRLAGLHGVGVATQNGVELMTRLAEQYASVEVDLDAYALAYYLAVREAVGFEQLQAAGEALMRATEGDSTGLRGKLDG